MSERIDLDKMEARYFDDCYLSGDVFALTAEIRHLTAELARRQQQVESLRAACQWAISMVNSDVDDDEELELAVEMALIGQCLESALAATSEPGGEGGGR